MLGTFHDDQPQIEIQVSGTSDNPKKLMALVDSGFNGYLALPYVEAFPLGLILTGAQRNILADGSSSEYFVCTGAVCVDGKCVSTGISIQPGGDILLGTRLLKKLGKTFVLDCKNGRVEIVDSEA
jgi:predicted aspartyl protease